MNPAGFLSRIEGSASLRELEELRVALLGKKGEITLALQGLGALPPEERKARGAAINQAKQRVAEALEQRRRRLELAEEAEKLTRERVDITLPVRPEQRGSLHPITQAMDEIAAIFASLGFGVRTGPLIEDDDHNFTALNIPAMHPARQMHDTFYVSGDRCQVTGDRKKADEPSDTRHPPPAAYLLRTHTSPVQIRTMRAEKPPFRIIAPGATFRCDSDQTHTPMFHQVEALLVDKAVHMGHLKGCVSAFLRAFFGMPGLPIRFRPSFFPFTEPSAEVDIGCARGRDALKIGEGSGWLEVMGCGMVHPKVLENCGIDPKEWQGFALGAGVERLAMLKYNIPDLRTFFDSDARWLRHYGFSALDMPGAFGG